MQGTWNIIIKKSLIYTVITHRHHLRGSMKVTMTSVYEHGHSYTHTAVLWLHCDKSVQEQNVRDGDTLCLRYDCRAGEPVDN